VSAVANRTLVLGAAEGRFELELTDAAPCAFRKYGRGAVIRCVLHGGLLCRTRTKPLPRQLRLWLVSWVALNAAHFEI
jgi:hypothetical protein